MPPQVASRAFDAFRTTKDAGKGTGLGLDIARRTTVGRHGGLITIDSQPREHGAAGPPSHPAAQAHGGTLSGLLFRLAYHPRPASPIQPE